MKGGLALSGLALGAAGGSAQWSNSLGEKVLINPLGGLADAGKSSNCTPKFTAPRRARPLQWS